MAKTRRKSVRGEEINELRGGTRREPVGSKDANSGLPSQRLKGRKSEDFKEGTTLLGILKQERENDLEIAVGN